MIKSDITCEEFLKKIFDTYKLIGVLADKNNCRALRLRHKTLQRDIVLHQLPAPSQVYELLSKFRCDSLPEVYDTITLLDGQIVLEEYVDGLTVSQIMESGRYHPHGTKRIILRVCNALSFLHNNGIVHRDIKPENIIVGKNGRVVLLDFNASRYITPQKKDTEIMGTAGYASPELIGTAHSDIRTDIYAMGVLINVMLTGKHPTQCIPKGRVGRIVRKCTAIHPDERYQNAEALAKAVQKNMW